MMVVVVTACDWCALLSVLYLVVLMMAAVVTGVHCCLQQEAINQQWNQAERIQKTIEKTADEVTLLFMPALRHKKRLVKRL